MFTGVPSGSRLFSDPRIMNLSWLYESKGMLHTRAAMLGMQQPQTESCKFVDLSLLFLWQVAMKVIDKKKALQDPYVSRTFRREAKLLQMVRHPNILQLLEIIETDNSYYLITELCSGNCQLMYNHALYSLYMLQC